MEEYAGFDAQETMSKKLKASSVTSTQGFESNRLLQAGRKKNNVNDILRIF
jgi:hypothetical protein